MNGSPNQTTACQLWWLLRRILSSTCRRLSQKFGGARRKNRFSYCTSSRLKGSKQLSEPQWARGNGGGGCRQFSKRRIQFFGTPPSPVGNPSAKSCLPA